MNEKNCKTRKGLSLFLILATLTLLFTALLPATVSAGEPEPAEIQDFGYQTLASLNLAGDETTELRFLFTIGSLEYTEVGFVLSKTNAAPEIDGDACYKAGTTTVYKTVAADGEQQTAGQGRFWVAVKMTGIPHAYFDGAFFIRAFVTDGAGTRYSETASLTVCSAAGHVHATGETYNSTGTATLITAGTLTSHCAGCNLDVTENDVLRDGVVFESNAASYPSGTKMGNNLAIKQQTYAAVRGENHFYPDASNGGEGNDLLVEFSILWNNTFPNNSKVGVIYVSRTDKSTQRNAFQFDVRANIDGQDCKFAGGFEPNGKRNILSGEYTMSGDSFPSIGEYGWHRIATRIHQDQIYTGGKVQYVMTVTLYIDGVEICMYDTIHDRWTEKPLYNAATNDGGANWSYSDNDDGSTKVSAFYVDTFAVNTGSKIYLVFDDVYVTCGQDFVQDVRPVADPVDRTITLGGNEYPAAFYYESAD